MNTQTPQRSPETHAAYAGDHPLPTMSPGEMTGSVLESVTPALPGADGSIPPSMDAGPLPRRFGRYELLEVLGRGGMGIVYKARQEGLDRVIAIKMILAGEGASPEVVQRFLREANAASSLDHPNIVAIHDCGVEEGKYYYTMAFVEGRSLAQLVRDSGVPASTEAARLMLGISDAVAYAHSRGFIHRDLKPDNVMVDASGRPRILDFGLARRIDGDGNLSRTGQVLGTPKYMAPEQASGDPSKIGPSSDLYALGGILYYLLTGRPPFEGDTIMDTLIQVLQRPPTPPREFNPDVLPGLEALCLKCLAKEPADRLPSAEALCVALEEWAPVPSRLPSRVYTNGTNTTRMTSPPAPSRGGFKLALAVGVVLLIGLGVFLATRPKGDKNDDPNEPVPPIDLRRDFGLKVELIGGTKLPDGNVEIRTGDVISLRIETARDAYIGVWDHSQSGKITQLFPNEDEKDHFVKAGKARLVPGEDTYKITANANTKPESIHVVASTRPWDALEGEKAGPFAVFVTLKAQEALERTMRDLVLVRKQKPGEPPPHAVAEEMVRYRVR